MHDRFDPSWHSGCFRACCVFIEQTEADDMEWSGRTVAFAVRDISLPSPESVLIVLHGDDLLRGTVVGLSEGTRDHKSYAVVEVQALEQPVVVAIDKLRT